MAVFRSTAQVQRDAFPHGRDQLLLDYFVKIWKSDADYKVFMARRAFNLNRAMMRAYDAENNFEYHTETILTQTGILLSSGELADYYILHGYFPVILICDDILVHGRSVKRLIDRLHAAITKYAKQKNPKVDSRQIKKKLLEAVEFHVFAQNESGILLDDRYEIQADQQISSPQLKVLSSQISDYLKGCGIANTSFVLSGELPMHVQHRLFRDPQLMETSTSFCYRGRTQLVFYKNRGGILETIRIHCPDDYSEYNGVITSLVLFGDIEKTDLDRLCDRIAVGVSKYIPGGKISEILRLKMDEMEAPKMQLLHFLLSIFCLVEFLQEALEFDNNEVYQFLLRSDYTKIACNFDFSYRLRREFMRLFNAICFEGFKADWLYALLVNNGAIIPLFVDKSPDNQFHQARLGLLEMQAYEDAEDIFYKKGMEAEAEADEYVRRYKEYDTTKPSADSIELKRYLRQMNEAGIIQNTSSIGCMLGLLDSGLVAMNTEADRKGSQIYYMKTYLKAGELATSVYARIFTVFMPALALVEQNYKRVDKYRKPAVKKFIDYLQEHCYSVFGVVEPDDRKLAEKLKKKEDELLLLYNGAQTFSDWTDSLVTYGDRSGIRGNKTENHPSEAEEQKRKRFYYIVARNYLGM